MKALYLIIAFAPLVGAVVAGLFGKTVGRAGAHWATILSVAVSFAGSCVVFADVLNGNTFNGNVYTWVTMGGDAGSTALAIGFQIDRLSALMANCRPRAATALGSPLLSSAMSTPILPRPSAALLWT